jgi:hypothetical protein
MFIGGQLGVGRAMKDKVQGARESIFRPWNGFDTYERREGEKINRVSEVLNEIFRKSSVTLEYTLC